MKPVATARTNQVIGPPPGREDEFGSLPGYREDTDHGEMFYAVYELDDTDRQAIANGWNLRLGVGWIGVFPPVSLGVTYEQHDEFAAAV